MLNMLFAVLTSRLAWGFVGITALSFIIWVIGPVFSIVDSRPLEPEQNRVISIALLYLVWGLSQAIPRLYNMWLNRKLMSSLETRPSGESEQDRKCLTNEEQVLASRFGEATEMLKKAHFQRHNSKGTPFWAQRFSRQYLYQLPWYMIIGAPGAGKTTALVNSGLQFPLADKFGKAALRVSGARATATGGLPMMLCCWTPPDAMLLRRANRSVMPVSGTTFWRCSANIVVASRSMVSSSP